ncbi:MAG: GFA family protein [Pseudomonadota bacterium]
MLNRRSGQCLCGSVRYTVTLPSPHYTVCHCSMCRRFAAGPFMAVHARGDDVTWNADTGLTWFKSSEWAERGFCNMCGASLFYRIAAQPEMMLIASVDSLDDASDITLAKHIYVDHQPERYAFADGCPRRTEAEVLADFGIVEGGTDHD